MGEVIFYPRTPQAALNPCPEQVNGPFLGSDATYLACALLKGHEGSHYFHVEWGPHAGSPSRLARSEAP